ncbi:MAG: hypothetical protein RJA63_830 [Pseudomonadota bacterium]|jgi:tRNA (guanine-N7-)-methyltransferase
MAAEGLAPIRFVASRVDDAERLVALRIEAMRDSLTRLGRFDPQRARDRFLEGFKPETCELVLSGERLVGFVVVKPGDQGLLLDHLYIAPSHQGLGIGAVVLQRVFERADAEGLCVTVGALRGSDANRFYARHGFVQTHEAEWDIYYRRDISKNFKFVRDSRMANTLDQDSHRDGGDTSGMTDDQNAQDDAPTRFSRQPIRSFVLRQGRMSDAQKRYMDELLPRYAIPYKEAVLDAAATFGRKAPVVLEIGCGMGDTTVKIASIRPETDFIGIEVHGPGVGNLCKLIDEHKLTNLRVMQHDATEVVRDMLAPDSLAGIHVYFPDPWPKKRHHKRRILQPAFVAKLASRLAPGGYLHCATDWEEYAQFMLETLSAEPLLQNTAADYAEKPDYRPLTKFEARGLRLGHGVWDLVFKRV